MRFYPSGNLNIEKTIVNKRLSRARVTIECTFGIFSNKWRGFMKSIETKTKHAKLVNYDNDFVVCMTNLENRNPCCNIWAQ
nr:unnamed protein product [Callosobruchus analis]